MEATVYKQYDMITLEDNKKLYCLLSCYYKRDSCEYIFVTEFEDDILCDKGYVMKVYAEDKSLEEITDAKKEIEILKFIKERLIEY